MSNSDALLENKQPDQHISDLIPNGASHDSHVTGNTNAGEFDAFDQVLLTGGNDPYYDFNDGVEGQSASHALDPSISDNIPFYEDFCVEDSPNQFDPVLFDSILSSNDDILSRLESTSSVGSGETSHPVLSYDLVVDNEGAGSGTGSELEGEEEGKKEELRVTEEGEYYE